MLHQTNSILTNAVINMENETLSCYAPVCRLEKSSSSYV